RVPRPCHPADRREVRGHLARRHARRGRWQSDLVPPPQRRLALFGCDSRLAGTTLIAASHQREHLAGESASTGQTKTADREAAAAVDAKTLLGPGLRAVGRVRPRFFPTQWRFV